MGSKLASTFHRAGKHLQLLEARRSAQEACLSGPRRVSAKPSDVRNLQARIMDKRAHLNAWDDGNQEAFHLSYENIRHSISLPSLQLWPDILNILPTHVRCIQTGRAPVVIAIHDCLSNHHLHPCVGEATHQAHLADVSVLVSSIIIMLQRSMHLCSSRAVQCIDTCNQYKSTGKTYNLLHQIQVSPSTRIWMSKKIACDTVATLDANTDLSGYSHTRNTTLSAISANTQKCTSGQRCQSSFFCISSAATT